MSSVLVLLCCFYLVSYFYFLNSSTAAAIAAKGSTSLLNCPTGAVTPPITAPGAPVIADPAFPIASWVLPLISWTSPDICLPPSNNPLAKFPKPNAVDVAASPSPVKGPKKFLGVGVRSEYALLPLWPPAVLRLSGCFSSLTNRPYKLPKPKLKSGSYLPNLERSIAP